MMNSVRWLHLSDIHFNLKDEQCIDARNFLPDYIESIIKQKNDKFDFIAISGDCTYQNSGYAGVPEYLYKFKQLLKDECQNNFFIVPGNHDLKRKIPSRTNLIDSFYSNNIEEGVIDKRLYTNNERDSDTFNKLSEALSSDFVKFYEDVTKYKYNCDKICEIRSLGNINQPVNLIHINTCLFSYEKDNDGDKIGKLLIDTRGIKEELNKCRNLDNHLNIAIGHHELDCFYVEDREKFKQLLLRYHIDIYLCGHTHVPKNKRHKIKESETSIICAGAITADGSDINFSLGELSFEDGKGFIEHHKWKKELWDINHEISDELDSVAQWRYVVRKFSENPVIVKERNPLSKEIKQRFGEFNTQYFDNLEELKKELSGIHLDKVDNYCSCEDNEINRCQEGEMIFSELFRTTLFKGTQSNIFSNEDILIITILIWSYNIYKYSFVMKDSSIKGELGRIINKYTRESKLTDVCIEVLTACFNESKFNKMQYNLSPIEGMVVHPKLLAVVIRFIDRLTYRKCGLCEKMEHTITDRKNYRKSLNSYNISFNNTNKRIEITCEIDEERAFDEKIKDKTLFRNIIDEIQSINDDRVIFNSYCGHICLIDIIVVKISFINKAYGYDRTIYTINDSISSIYYNGFGDPNENYHNLFVKTYPNFDEQAVKGKIRKLKEES
jgi:predicted phosphodiesterase